MKPVRMRVFAIIMMLVSLSMITSQVSAVSDDENSSLMVSIESADYLDLDGDLVDDDILIEFNIENPINEWSFGVTFIKCELELPSGRVFYCMILIIGTYSRVSITLGWRNTAVEAGWYDLSICAFAYGFNAPEPGSASILFDPPTEGAPGSPTAEIMEIIIEP